MKVILGAQKVCRRCMEGVQKVHGRYADSHERCTEGTWEVVGEKNQDFI